MGLTPVLALSLTLSLTLALTLYQVMWETYKVRSRWRADGGLIDPKATGPAYALPSALLDGLSWDDVLAALDHEEGRGVNGGERVATADERLRPKPGKLGGI